MPRFFFDPEDNLSPHEIVLVGENARHISLSLRMKVGDPITLCDGCAHDHDCVIEKIDRESVTARVLGVTQSKTEPPYKAALYQSLAKGEKMDLIIQKAVELGVSEIVPVESRNCVVKLDRESGDKLQKKIARWQRIADEAAGQCGRGIPPRVHPPLDFSSALERAGQSDLSLFCYEGDRTRPLPVVIGDEKPRSISIFIGPEGGYSDEEYTLAADMGAIPTGLGKRILRTETAGLYVLSVLSFALER